MAPGQGKQSRMPLLYCTIDGNPIRPNSLSRD
jgi:hypothetical protein